MRQSSPTFSAIKRRQVMKLTILGAAGVRTLLVLQSIIARQHKVGLSELALMDVDLHRLEMMRDLCED